ncbi:20153_t:CDS:2 [Cetraspora pellucida]|uniref:20153_t:CDS:1 n=1 Tax=Cetraspora pellucida TaxID=1433469 RepID=A0A9N9NEQ2_9GLOM|nr:20153_t:CDS:2 [Cetraspora pellucida]
MEHNKRSNRLDLVSKEDYIKYLEKEISIQNKELNPLRSEISNLIKQLEKVFKESKNQENYIAYLEKQLSLSENQAMIQNNRIQREINNIRQYFQSPVTIASTINGIIDYLNIISDAGNRFERLVLDIYLQVNTRAINAENQLAMLQNDYNLLYQAYEAHKTQHNIFKSQELDGRITIHTQKRQISELLAEKFILCLLNRQTQKQLQNCKADGKTRARNSKQLINNLNQQILQLQNNMPILVNMATIQEVIAVITLLIAPIPQYIGQKPPEDYVNKIKQLYNCGSTLDVVAAFNDVIKTQILASKIGGKYIPPNLFNNQAGVAVNTPALFLAWLNTEYQRNNIGTQQIATQRLTQEKFMPYNTPETYETRIKPFLLGVPNNDNYVLGLQKNIPPPLPPGHEYRLEEFYINNFMNDQARQIRIGITPTPLSKLPPGGKIIHPKSEKAKALQKIIDYTRLGLDIEDERPYDPMEIDLAIVNIARRIGGNTTIPTTNIVNASRTEEEVYEKIVYEDKDNENVEYVEVEDRPEEMLCNNSTIEQKVIEICKKIFQDELRNILNKFKTLLSSYNLLPELASSMALDEPIDINLVCHSANDLTTAEYRINNILIPKMVLDGGSQSTMLSKKLARHLRLKIDTTNPPSLEGVATNASSYGWCYNVPITFSNRSLTRDTDYTIIHNVIVIDYDKYALIIGTNWLDLAGGKVDYKKCKFRVGNIFVPISVHRSNIKVNCITTDQDSKDYCSAIKKK